MSFTPVNNNDIVAIKQKTDNLPATPSAKGDAMTLSAAYDAAKIAPDNANIAILKTDIEDLTHGLPAIKSGVVTIPTNPLLTNDIRLNDLDATISSRLATIDVAIPSINYSGNVNIRDVIGGKLDDEGGSSLFAHAYTQLAHTHSAQKVYPTLANGVTITGAAGAWALGAFAVIVPANTIPNPFDIHHLNVAAYNSSDTFEIVLYSGPNGAEVEIGRVRVTRISNVGASPHVVMMTPLIAANSQIKAKVASQNGTSNTITISIIYHEY